MNEAIETSTIKASLVLFVATTFFFSVPLTASANTCQSSVTGFSPGDGNYLNNPNFDCDNRPVPRPAYWSEYGSVDASYVESGGSSTPFRLTLAAPTPFSVFTSQVQQLRGGVSGVPVTTAICHFSANAVRSRTHKGDVYAEIKGYGGNPIRIGVQKLGWPNWSRIEASFQVTNGYFEVGFYSSGLDGQDWSSFSSVRVTC